MSMLSDGRISASGHASLQAGRSFALGTGSLQGESDVVASYGHWCERRGTPGDCLSLSEDDPYLDASDKRHIAFALAVAPAMEGALSEVRTTLVVREWLRTKPYEVQRDFGLMIMKDFGAIP
jgi:hypothetical protein